MKTFIQACLILIVPSVFGLACEEAQYQRNITFFLDEGGSGYSPGINAQAYIYNNFVDLDYVVAWVQVQPPEGDAIRQQSEGPYSANVSIRVAVDGLDGGYAAEGQTEARYTFPSQKQQSFDIPADVELLDFVASNQEIGLRDSPTTLTAVVYASKSCGGGSVTVSKDLLSLIPSEIGLSDTDANPLLKQLAGRSTTNFAWQVRTRPNNFTPGAFRYRAYVTSIPANCQLKGSPKDTPSITVKAPQ